MHTSNTNSNTDSKDMGYLNNYSMKPQKKILANSEMKEDEVYAYDINQDSVIEKPISFENYICILCENIVRNPKICKECEILYCEKCFNSCLKFDTRCPNCRKGLSEGIIPRIVRNTLNEIKVFCPYLCGEGIKICNLKNHFDTSCGKVSKIAQCLSCKKEFEYQSSDAAAASQLQKHFELCPERKIECKFCNKYFYNKNIAQHILDCDQRPIECPECFILLRKIRDFPHDSFVCEQIRELKKAIDIKEKEVAPAIGNLENYLSESKKEKSEIEKKELNNTLNIEDSGAKKDNKIVIDNCNDSVNNGFIMNKLFNLKYKLVGSINSKINAITNEDKPAGLLGDLNVIGKNVGNSLQKKVFNLISNYIFDSNAKNNNENIINANTGSQKNEELNSTAKLNQEQKLINTADNNKNICINNSNNNNLSNPDNNKKNQKIKAFNPWDLKQTFSKAAHKSEINAILFVTNNSPDKYSVVTAGGDSHIKIWDSSAVLINSIPIGDQCINALLNFKSNNKIFKDYQSLLISGGSGRDLQIFDFQTRKFLFNLSAHSEAVNCLEQIKSKKNEFLVASGGLDAKVIIWDIYQKSVLHVLKEHSDSVNALASVCWDRNDFSLASASSDKTIKIWNAWEGVLLGTLKGHSKSVTDICFFNVAKKSLVLENNKDALNSNMDIANQNSNDIIARLNLIASCSWDQTIRLWDCETGLQLKAFKAHNISVSSIIHFKFSEDKVILASAGYDKTIKFWSLSSEDPVATIYGHLEKIKKINKLVIDDEESKILLLSGGVGVGDEYANLKFWIN